MSAGAPRAEPPPAPTSETTRQRVWDPVVRLTHWGLAITVVAGYVIGENMTFANIRWHFYLGYATATLLTIRLLWGLVGPRPARIASLFSTPKTFVGYAATLFDRRPSHWPGHNPIGAVSVIALWGLLAAMVVTGLFSESDDFFETAPLAVYASSDMRLTMTALHKQLHVFVAPLVLLHLSAIAFYYLWKRENLVRPMITGWKLVRRR